MTSASDMATCSGVAGGLAAGQERRPGTGRFWTLNPVPRCFCRMPGCCWNWTARTKPCPCCGTVWGGIPNSWKPACCSSTCCTSAASTPRVGEVARLAGLFRSHPDFWEAWGDVSASAGGSADLAVSLGFLGALFRHEGLTLADVLAAGLKALRASPAGRDAAASPNASPAATSAPRFDDLPLIFAAEDSSPDRQNDVSSDISSEAASPFSFDALSTPSSASPFIPGDGQEKCSLRTRSMAEVLAEQGDVRGAADIYEELLVSCRPEDRAALTSRLEDLRTRLGAEGGASPVSRASASAPARTVPSARNGMLDLLEKLAVRLETKARQ